MRDSKRLYKRLTQVHITHIIGYTNDMAGYMRASDILSKSQKVYPTRKSLVKENIKCENQGALRKTVKNVNQYLG